MKEFAPSGANFFYVNGIVNKESVKALADNGQKYMKKILRIFYFYGN